MNSGRWFFHVLMITIFAAAGLLIPTLPVEGQKVETDGISRVFFIENVGQFSGAGRFILSGERGYIWVAPDGIWVTRMENAPVEPARGTPNDRREYVGGVNLHFWFKDSNPEVLLEPFGRLEPHVSYLKGSDPADWFVDVPVWSGVRYVDLYPGVDLVLETDTTGDLKWHLESDAVEQLDRVRLMVEGADDVIAEDDVLRMATSLGEYELSLFQVEQELTLLQPDTESQSSITETAVGEFEVLSPFTAVENSLFTESSLQGQEDLLFSTFLGGSGTEIIHGLAVNEQQEVFAAGETLSTDFPVSAGAFDISLNSVDAFVVRMNKDGNGIVYATYLGGSARDEAAGIAIQGSTAYVVGSTTSTDFPLAGLNSGESDAFVAALNSTGTNLIYSKLHGGSGDDFGYGIDVESGYAYITGTTQSRDIPGGFTKDMKGFAAKFDSSGTRSYATVFGGRNLDAAYAISVSGGNAYITGESDSADLGGGTDPAAGFDDAYVVKLDPVGTKLWGFMIGGTQFDRGNAIVVDADGRAIIAGATDSTDMVVDEGSNAGGYDGFIAVLNASGTAWDYAAYLGGTGWDYPRAIAIDAGGKIQLAGSTSSPDFPVTDEAYQVSLAGDIDAFVALYDLAGLDPGHRSYVSYLGGSAADHAWGLAIDPWGYTYMGGETRSSDFPHTTGAFDTTLSGLSDGFITKMAVGPVPGIVIEKNTNGSDADTPPGPHLLTGSTVNWSYWVLNTGPLELSDVTVGDDQGVTINCPKTTLGLGESMICTASGTAVLGQYSNIGSVTASPPGDLPAVSDADPSHYFGVQPSIQVVKKTNGFDSNTPPGQAINVGSRIYWTYDVTNTGNVSLTNILVSDSDESLVVTCPRASLGAYGSETDSMQCTASGIAIGGNYVNTATVTGDPPDSLPQVSDTDMDHYQGVGPDVMITKEISVDGGSTWLPADVSPGPSLLSGNIPMFRITITNNGDTMLESIIVADSEYPLDSCSFSTTLAIGAATSCVITPAWEAGQQVNTAGVSASYTDSSSNTVVVTDSDLAHYFGAQAGLTVLKEVSLDNGVTWQDTDGPGGESLLAAFSPPKYRITVQNTGNVVLLTTLIDNQLAVPGSCAATLLQPDDLTPGSGLDQAVCEITGSWAAGLRTNTATASASYTDGGGHTANLSVLESAAYFGANPALSLAMDVSLDGGATWLAGDTAPGPYLLDGGAAPQFRMTLSNTGNVLIENIQITDDDLPLDGCDAPFALDPGADKTCTASTIWSAGAHVVGVSSAASYTDSVGNIWNSNLVNAAYYFGADPQLSLTKDISIDGGVSWLPADNSPGPTLLIGEDQPQFRFVLTNTGNVSLSITLTDTALILPESCGNGVLEPAANRECIVTGTWAAGEQVNTAQAAASFVDAAGTIRNQQIGNTSHYFGAQPQLDLEKLVSGDGGVTWQDADDQPGPFFLNTISPQYKLILENTGNVTLTGLSWNDPTLTLTGCTLPSSMTAEAAPFECVVTANWSAGQVDNLAIASGAFIDDAGHQAAPSDTDAAHYFGAQPGVTITKRTNDQDANSAPGPYILMGEPVTWTYTITNSGNVPLTEIAVMDDNGTPLDASDDFSVLCDSTELAPSAGQTCEASATAVEGQYANTATVTTQPKVGDMLIGAPITSSDISHYFGARISMTLEKTTNGESDDNSPPGPFIMIGQTVPWTYKVTNTGNIAIGSINVMDDNGTPSNPADDRVVCPITTLDPGKSNNPNACKWSAPAIGGQYMNVGTAAMEMLGIVFSATDLGHYYGYDPDDVLGLILKINDQTPIGEPPVTYLNAGGEINLVYSVYNGSPEAEITVTQLTDDNGTPLLLDDDEVVCQDITIQPLSVQTCSRTITALSGWVEHSGIVAAALPGEPLPEKTVKAAYFGVTPGISIIKLTNGQDPAGPLDLLVKTGTAVTWEYEVTNTSNVDLNVVTVTDSRGVSVNCPYTGLALGEGMTCTASGTAQAGSYSNIGSVSGTPPGGLAPFTASAASYYYGVLVGITMDFRVNDDPADESPGPEFPEGQTITFSYEVTNTGNYEMVDVLVIDSAAGMISCPKTVLAAGETMVCTPQEIVTLGGQSRLATVTGKVNGENISDNDPVYFTGIEDEYFVFLPLIIR